MIDQLQIRISKYSRNGESNSGELLPYLVQHRPISFNYGYLEGLPSHILLLLRDCPFGKGSLFTSEIGLRVGVI